MVIEEILIKMETHESIPFSSTENALQVLCFKKLISQAGPSKKKQADVDITHSINQK